MAAADAIKQVLGMDNFADYEQTVYDKYQENAEHEIVDNLNITLSSMPFLQLLKVWVLNAPVSFMVSVRLRFNLSLAKNGKFYHLFFSGQDQKKKAVHRNDRREP